MTPQRPSNYYPFSIRPKSLPKVTHGRTNVKRETPTSPKQPKSGAGQGVRLHSMGVWQGVAMDLKFQPGPPCLTLLCPVGGLPLRRPYGRFRGGPPAGWVACGRLLPLQSRHAVRLCCIVGRNRLIWGLNQNNEMLFKIIVEFLMTP
jgi:hypothetical protein